MDKEGCVNWILGSGRTNLFGKCQGTDRGWLVESTGCTDFLIGSVIDAVASQVRGTDPC